MFGCILAGQQVRTDFQVVTDTDLVLKLDNLQSSFLTLFMTGEKPFPDGLGSVFEAIFSWLQKTYGFLNEFLLNN